MRYIVIYHIEGLISNNYDPLTELHVAVVFSKLFMMPKLYIQ